MNYCTLFIAWGWLLVVYGIAVEFCAPYALESIEESGQSLLIGAALAYTGMIVLYVTYAIN